MKKTIAVLVMAVMMVFMSACGSQDSVSLQPDATTKAQGQKQESTTAGPNQDANTVRKDFGTYQIPKTWVEDEKMSTENKFYYLPENKSTDDMSDGIYVKSASSSDGLDKLEQTKSMLTENLEQQVSEMKNTTLTTGEFKTKNGDTVFWYQIFENDDNVTTTQYYIMGEKKYALVQETNYSGSTATDDIAKMVCNSFVWAE